MREKVAYVTRLKYGQKAHIHCVLHSLCGHMMISLQESLSTFVTAGIAQA